MQDERPDPNAPGARFRQRCDAHGVRAITVYGPSGPVAVPPRAWIDLVAGALDEHDIDDDDTPEGDLAHYVAIRRWVGQGAVSWAPEAGARPRRWGGLYLDLAGVRGEPTLVWDEPEEGLRVVLGPADHVLATLELTGESA